MYKRQLVTWVNEDGNGWEYDWVITPVSETDIWSFTPNYGLDIETHAVEWHGPNHGWNYAIDAIEWNGP